MRGGQLPFPIVAQHRAVEVKDLDEVGRQSVTAKRKMDCHAFAEAAPIGRDRHEDTSHTRAFSLRRGSPHQSQVFSMT